MKFADTPLGCSKLFFFPFRSQCGTTNPLAAWLFELAGGALTDFDNTCVPKSQREAAFTIAALHQWEMDINDDRCEASAEEVGIPSPFYSASIDLLTTRTCKVDIRDAGPRLFRWTIPQRKLSSSHVRVGILLTDARTNQFLGRHEPAERAKASFGPNWDRLCEIKKQYDPTNVFRNTFWPLNAQGDMVDPRTHEPPTPKFEQLTLST